MFSLLADKSATELANTGATQGELEVAETGTMEAVSAEDQPSDTAACPSIFVLNDLWRYVPAYFQTRDAVQPRSEAGRRLLERRRRQIERQQQQRKSAITASETGENQRGTLPVDQLLAYITNSASATSSSTSCKGRRKKKQSTPSSDAVLDGSSSSRHAIDAADKSQGENVLHEVGKKELQPDNVTTSDVADGDAADFVVVRRGRKYRPAYAAAERPTQLKTEVPIGRHHRHKATFYDLLDEFSLKDDNAIMHRADHAGDNKSAASTDVDDRSISATTKSSQTLPLSTTTTHLFEVSSHHANLDNPTTPSECHRPVTVLYNDVVKRNRHNWQEKSAVVDISTESSTNYRHNEPCLRPSSDLECVQTTNSPTMTNGNDGQDGVLTTDVHPVDVSTTQLNHDSSTRYTKHVTVGHVVGTVSCSTQTSSVEISRYSTPPPSSSSTAVLNVTGNGNPPRRPNPVEFLDANCAKADTNEMLHGASGLSFGSFDDITSTSLTESRDSDEVTTKSETIVRCSDAATSPIKLSPLTSSSLTSETKSLAASHCRCITPLCRTTGSSSSATGAPVGIVPPIMHVETASGDASVSADENVTREEVSHRCSILMYGL